MVLCMIAPRKGKGKGVKKDKRKARPKVRIRARARPKGRGYWGCVTSLLIQIQTRMTRLDRWRLLRNEGRKEGDLDHIHVKSMVLKRHWSQHVSISMIDHKYKLLFSSFLPHLIVTIIMLIYSTEDDMLKKTVLNMIHEKWPIGHYTFTDIKEKNPIG